MADKKITKREYFAAIIEAIKEMETVNGFDTEETVAFLNDQIATLEGQAQRAAEKRAEKKAAADELKATVMNLLTDEFQTVDDIVEAIEDEEITKPKIVARLTALIKEGVAVKEEVKLESGRKMAYKRA